MTDTTTPAPLELRNAGRWSNEEAQSILTLGEANAIQRHYGQEMSNVPGQGLYGLELAAGIIWALERRGALEAGAKLTSWADVDALPLASLNGYFLEAELEADPTEPEGEQGKELSPVV